MHQELTVTVNGTDHELEIDTRITLATLVREHLGLTGTHVGCRTGNCGACTVRLDGDTVKSCCVLAMEVDGHRVETVESLRDGDDLHPVQQAFADAQALQCGFCTAGMVMSAVALLDGTPDPTEDEVRRGLAGNLCRCTGYTAILDAVAAAARDRRVRS